MGRISTSPTLQAAAGGGGQHRRLSSRMKPSIKVKSPDVLPSKSRRVPLLKQLTSTLTKAPSPFLSKSYKAPSPEHTSKTSSRCAGNTTRTVNASRIGTRSQAKHSGLKWGPEVGSKKEKGKDARHKTHCAEDLDVSPIASPPEPTVAPLPTSLVASTRELRKTTVQRSKVKSPTNQLKVTRRREKAPVSNTSGKEENSDIVDGDDPPVKRKTRTPRTRMEELVQQVKKKDAEILTLSRKLNSTQKSLAEKEKLVRDLETKIPGMLADLKKNLEADEVKKRMNRDLKESAKRNKSLSGTMKQVEEQLKVKEEKYQNLLAAKRNSDAILKEKQKELKSFAQRGLNFERTIMDLERKLSQALMDVEREKEKRVSLETRCSHLLDDLEERERFIERLRTDVFHANNVAASRETEFEELKKQNLEMQRLVQNQEQMLMKKQEQDLHHYQPQKDKRNGGNLNSVTDDFLDRVSAVSREQNISVNLKMVVTRGQRSSVVERLVGPGNGPGFASTFITNNMEEIDGGEEDNVFEDNTGKEEEEGEEDLSDMQVESDSSPELSVYDALSSGTCRRLDHLGENVERLWSRLSTRDDRSNSLVTGKASFSDSVSRLERELDQSVLQHSSLLHRAGAVKRLFD